MCIIIVKPKGQKLPNKEIFEECFRINSDGAGMMFPVKIDKDGKIFEITTKGEHLKETIWIEKGFMTFDKFWDAIHCASEDGFILDEHPAVFHCRIQTTGDTNGANTHPFPVSNKIADLRQVEFATDLGVAHNGIIDIKTQPKNSDTQEFTKKTLSKYIPEIMLQDKDTHDLIKKAGGASKFCFLTTNAVTMLGSGWITDGGICYSNRSYKIYPKYESTNYLSNRSPFVYDKLLHNEMGNMIQDFWDFFTLFDMDWDKALYATYDKYRNRLKTPYINNRSGHGC